MEAQESKKTYNGWTNYETWVVKLWLDNEPHTYEHWTNEARRVKEEVKKEYDWQTDKQAQAYTLAHLLQESLENEYLDILEGANQSASVWSDLLSAAMSEVNWQEIAETYLDDLE